MEYYFKDGGGEVNVQIGKGANRQIGKCENMQWGKCANLKKGNMKNKHIVILTGAGISAESGLKTFRDSDGLWMGYNIEDVATPRGFAKDPAMVLDFYNQRRRDVANAKPNKAHIGLAELENDFAVTIITQNIDDLHEREIGRAHV